MIIDKFFKKPCFYYYIFQYDQKYAVFRTTTKTNNRPIFSCRMRNGIFSKELDQDKFIDIRSAIKRLRKSVKSKLYRVPIKYENLYYGRVPGVMFLSE